MRTYASAALGVAGFASSAAALASIPEIVDDDSLGEARSRVNAALSTVLSAREIPQTESALVATIAAREAVALALHDDPSENQLRGLIASFHTIA
ncbi:MAG TPA: hypothetical protein VGO62_12190 [Myxococcota bacterium]